MRGQATPERFTPFEFEDDNDEDCRRDIMDDHFKAMRSDDTREWRNFDWALTVEDLVLPMASSFTHHTSFLPHAHQAVSKGLRRNKSARHLSIH